MQLPGQTEHAPILSNVGETYKYKIQQSAKAFAVLSSCYSNKIRAIVREISCNGVDSHVAAGKPTTPIHVHLPTRLEPWFSVTDFGVGLDAAEVANVFTTYFASTKADSNEYIGALGLGSKSPFCKVQNFTVMATKDGYTRVFSAYMDEAGEPNVALMTEQLTNFPSGVEVTVPVDDQNDFYKYLAEAQYIFQHFKVQPVFTGDPSYRSGQLKYASELAKNVHLRYAETPGYNDQRAGCFAIMGSVAYPIDVPNSKQVLGELRDYLNYPIDIHFEIGELDILPSRESLSYISLTINAIRNKLQELHDNIYSNLTNKLITIDNEWDKLEYISTLKEYSSKVMHPSLIKLLTTDPAKLKLISKLNIGYNDQLSITCRFPKILVSELAENYNIKLSAFHNVYRHKRSKDVYADALTNITSSFISERCSSLDLNVIEIVFEFRARNSIVIINDLTKPSTLKARIEHNVNTLVDKYKVRKTDICIFVIDKIDNTKDIELDKFIKIMHNFNNVLPASTLEQPPVKVRAKLSKKVNYLRLAHSRYGKFVWHTAEHDISILDKTVQHYYCQLKGFDCINDFGFSNFKTFYHFIATVFPNLVTPNNIIAIRGDSAMTALQQMPNFKDINIVVKEKLLASKNEFARGIAFYNLLNRSGNRTGLFNRLTVDKSKYSRDKYAVVFDNICSKIDENSTFKKFWTDFKECTLNSSCYISLLSNNINEYQKALDFAINIENNIPNSNIADNPLVASELNKVVDTLRMQMNFYPMLEIVDGYGDQLITPARLEEYVKYINLVDNAITK